MREYSITLPARTLHEKKEITEETLKPITKANSKLEKELQELGVESTRGGGDLGQ